MSFVDMDRILYTCNKFAEQGNKRILSEKTSVMSLYLYTFWYIDIVPECVKVYTSLPFTLAPTAQALVHRAS